MRNLVVYNHLDEPMTILDGITALEKSLAWIRKNGFEAKTLENSLQLLHETDEMIREGFYQ